LKALLITALLGAPTPTGCNRPLRRRVRFAPFMFSTTLAPSLAADPPLTSLCDYALG